MDVRISRKLVLPVLSIAPLRKLDLSDARPIIKGSEFVLGVVLLLVLVPMLDLEGKLCVILEPLKLMSRLTISLVPTLDVSSLLVRAIL